MTQKRIGICLLGCGVVGSAVAKVLREQRALLLAKTGIDFELAHLVVRDAGRLPPELRSLPVTTDAIASIDDPRSQIIVELIGGTATAGEYIERALNLGKPVVTANKSLLAAHGNELFALARKHNTCIGFEASCGGGIPIIGALLQGLIANDVQAILGIVNGTCNFILTQMTQKGASYADALVQAQTLGFAEANPAMDVSGRDAAQKLCLLAGLAFGVRIGETDVLVEGIDTLESVDIGFAKELGYVIKLLAIAERADGDRISLRVHPTLVHQNDMLAEVNGSFNAISVYGSALGHALFYGRGAGGMPTASAVLSDIAAIALGTAQRSFSQLPVFGEGTRRVSPLPINELRSRYYLRLTATDTPGVFAQVTEVLGRHNISLAAVSQHECTGGEAVPIVITTHQAFEGEMRAAIQEIDALHRVSPPSVCLRIIDQPTEFSK